MNVQFYKIYNTNNKLNNPDVFKRCNGNRGSKLMLNTSIKQMIKPLLVVSFVSVIVWLINHTISKESNQTQQSYIISANDFQLLQSNL